MATASRVLLATAFDARYLPFAASLVQTLAEHRAPRTVVNLTVLHGGDIGRIERADLEEVGDGLEFNWVTVTDRAYRPHGLRKEGLLAGPQYFRCLLPELLPESVTRVIYLDADTMVLGDLGPLYQTALGDAPVAAVLDWLPTVREAVAPWRELGLAGDAPYFNSGVLVIDIERWRAERVGGRALSRCLVRQP